MHIALAEIKKRSLVLRLLKFFVCQQTYRCDALNHVSSQVALRSCASVDGHCFAIDLIVQCNSLFLSSRCTRISAFTEYWTRWRIFTVSKNTRNAGKLVAARFRSHLRCPFEVWSLRSFPKWTKSMFVCKRAHCFFWSLKCLYPRDSPT